MRNEKRVKVTAALAGVMALLLVAATPLGHPALRLKASPSTVWDDSDPTVLVEGTHTYLFGSSNNRKVPVRQITSFSSSLATSQAYWAAHSADAMPTRPAWVNPAKWQIWAPSVVKIGTQFLMYFASHNAAATTDKNNDQCIGRAVSSSPMGPYRPSAAPLYCGLPAEGAVGGLPASNRFGRGALDPDVFLAHDGHLYLIVALSRTNASIGEVPLSAGGLPTGGLNTKANTLAGVSLPWQDGTDNTTLTPGSFLENPSMIYEPQTKTYLLFYSGGRWATAAYLTGFARCAHAYGPCTLERGGPFLMSGNGRTGVGGLTAFVSSAGALRVAYSSWTAGHEGQSGSVGQYSRQVTWGLLSLSAGSDPATQTVTLH